MKNLDAVTAPEDIPTKDYVDVADTARVLKSGDTMSGPLTVVRSDWTPGVTTGTVEIRGRGSSVGIGSGQSASMTGDYNVAVGANALNKVTSGQYNVAVGSDSLFSLATGNNNMALGLGALRAAVASSDSVAIGTNTLRDGTAPTRVVAIGTQSGRGVTNGTDSVHIGYNAGWTGSGGVNKSTSASRQTLVGSTSGQSSTTQSDGLVAIGYQAQGSGAYAVAIGAGALAGFAGSVALGVSAAGVAASTAKADQVVLGTAAHEVSVPGSLVVAGNAASALQAVPKQQLDADLAAHAAAADPHTVYVKKSGDTVSGTLVMKNLVGDTASVELSPSQAGSGTLSIKTRDSSNAVRTNTQFLYGQTNFLEPVYFYWSVTLGQDPASDLEAATKRYVDSKSGGITRSVVSISSATTAGEVANTDYFYLCTGGLTLTLPTAVGNKNLYTVKRTGTGTVTIATTASQTIDGAATLALAVQYQSVVLVSDGANWSVASEYMTRTVSGTLTATTFVEA